MEDDKDLPGTYWFIYLFLLLIFIDALCMASEFECNCGKNIRFEAINRHQLNGHDVRYRRTHIPVDIGFVFIS